MRLRPTGRDQIVTGVVAAGLLGLPAGAHAWGNLLLLDPPPAQTAWAAGASVWSLPRFPGAGSKQGLLLPAFEWRNPEGLFASTDSGLGWNLSPRADAAYGLRLWPQWGRAADDAPAGLGAVGPRLQAELFANHQPFEALLLQSGILAGAGQHHDGLQVEVGATTGLPIGADLLGLGISATWTNAAYRRSYFGLDAAQAARSGLPAYDPGSGWTDTSLILSFEHRFNARWRFDLQAFQVLYAPAIGRSPLVARRRQQALTASLWHDF